jgi:hypothetical protein
MRDNRNRGGFNVALNALVRVSEWSYSSRLNLAVVIGTLVADAVIAWTGRPYIGAILGACQMPWLHSKAHLRWCANKEITGNGTSSKTGGYAEETNK